MPFGYTGKCLDIDLCGRTITQTRTLLKHVEKYLGGRGMATRMFMDRVSSETDPFSPDNPLIFAAGMLTGTPAPGANRTALVTRSPQTGLLTYSTIGGFWGAEFKRAGYDTLYIHGIAEEPVYLFIMDDQVEFKDARHLWGKKVCDTRRMLEKNHKPDKIQMLCIGPAGEQKVFASTIEHTMGAGAHRAGVGAVMGHKRLKAIVACGTQDIYVAHPTEFQATCETVISKTGPIRKYWNSWPAQNGSWLYSEAMHGNYEDKVVLENEVKTLTDFESAHKSGTAACFNCGAACKSTIRLPQGQYASVKCQSFFNFMFALKINDVHFSVRCFRLCEDYGLDVISTAYLTGFAFDLYQKGIITRADTGGLALRWGDQEAAFCLIDKIAKRQDIGDVLAHGVVKASKMIGRGADKYAFHVKKLEPIPYSINPYSALMSSISDRADQTRSEGFAASQGLEYYSPEWRKNYIRQGYFSYPRALRSVFENEYAGQENDYKDILPFASYDIDKNSLADCTGLCIFWTGFWQYNPIMVDDHVNLVRYAANISMDEEKAMDIAKRTAIMTRAYNVMTGMDRRDDTIHQRFFERSSDGAEPVIDQGRFDEMISRFYRLRGWDDNGIPSAAELDRLGLEDIRLKLEQSGLL